MQCGKDGPVSTSESLREQHRRAGGEQTSHPNIGDVLIVKDEKLGAVTKVIKGKDGIVRGATLRTSNGTIERPVQHLYPLELTCDLGTNPTLNPAAPEFAPRLHRDAAAAASARIREIAGQE